MHNNKRISVLLLCGAWVYWKYERFNKGMGDCCVVYTGNELFT